MDTEPSSAKWVERASSIHPADLPWTYIMTAEWYEQELAWVHIAEALDRGAHAVLKKVKRYPAKERDVDKVREKFWGGVES